VPTTSSLNVHHGDHGRLHPTSPSITSSSGTGPSPGISPVLSPQLSASNISKRSRSKSPSRARQRLHDISTITGLSLHEEAEDDEGEPTSVGILRHLSQTSGTGLSRATTTSRRSARTADHAGLRELITTLINEDEEGPVNSSRLSNHERASLAVDLAGEFKVRLEDVHIERRIKATMSDDLPTPTARERSASTQSMGTLARILSSTMGPGHDVSHLVDTLMRLPVQLIIDGDRTKQSSGQNLKMAGFQLLAVLLQLQDEDNVDGSVPAAMETQHDTRSRSSMIDLCLNSPIDIPSQSFNTPLATFEYAVSDLPDRITCLQALTRHGRDISLNQDVVRTLVRWHQMMMNGWKSWCAEPGSWELISGSEEIIGPETRGRRKDSGGKPGANDRDQSSSTITIHLNHESDAAPSDDTDAPVVVRSLCSLWNLLVAIISHNFPLFSGRDVETIIDMGVTMIQKGIEVTSLSSAPPISRPEGHPSASKSEAPSPKTVSSSRARSGSLLGKNRMLKVPAPPPTTSDTGVSQASTILSRSPSVKTRDGRAVSHGTSPMGASAPETKTAAIAGTSGTIPPWSRVLAPVLGLLRFLLQAKYLPPTSLVYVIQLFALCYGWRSDARSITLGVRPNDTTTSIVNNLDNKARSQIEQFFKDLFASKLVSRNAERCLRSLLAGKIRVDQGNEYESKAEYKRDIVIGALG
jgi:hypothetical protein